MDTGNIRSRRLAGTIRKYLSVELGRDVEDPRLMGVSIQDVELSSDLSLAMVTVRIDYGDDDDKARGELLKLLARRGPRLRSNLAPLLRVRRVPDLRFRYDVGQDHVRRIEKVLEEIREENAQRNEDDPASDSAAESDGEGSRG